MDNKTCHRAEWAAAIVVLRLCTGSENGVGQNARVQHRHVGPPSEHAKKRTLRTPGYDTQVNLEDRRQLEVAEQAYQNDDWERYPYQEK